MVPRKPKDWHPLLPVALRPVPQAMPGEPFRDWLRRRNDADDFRRALDALAKIEGPPQPEQSIERLALACVKACYFASQYRPADDPGAQYRKQTSAERKNTAALADAAATLRKLLAKNPKAATWALPREYSIRRYGGMERQIRLTNLLRLLNRYEVNLRGRLPELHGGPWLYRFTFACLHYETARERLQARTPDAAGALLFNLVFLFRKWTAHGTAVYQTAEPMPNGGRPCYAVAAALVAATLPVGGIDARNARTRVIALQRSGASLMHWPNDVRAQVTKP